MSQKATKPGSEESIFGPGPARKAETVLWDDKTVYQGETNEQWLSFEQGTEVQLDDYR